jgi:hypothetical protein
MRAMPRMSVDAMPRPAGEFVRKERRLYVAEMARQIARMETSIAIAKLRK